MRRACAGLMLAMLLMVPIGRAAQAVDLPASRSTPATLVLGSSHLSQIDRRPDVDWLRLRLTKGQNVLLRQSFDCLGTSLELLDPNLKRVASVRWQHEFGGAGEYTPKVSGTYFVVVRPVGWNEEDCGAEGDQGVDGMYPAQWRVDARRDCPPDASTTCVLPLNRKKVKGSSDFSADQDWFKIDVRNPGAYAFALESESRPSYSLRRANGSLIAQYVDDFTINLAKGRYYLAVASAEVGYSQRFEITAGPAR